MIRITETATGTASAVHGEMLALAEGTPWLFERGFTIGDTEGLRDGVFGYCSGGEYDISHLYHEIAHAIELFLENPDRLVRDRFNFSLPEQYVLGHRVVEPETTQSIERELRTFAIQATIMMSNPKLNFDAHAFIPSCAWLMQYMPDWINVSKHLTHPDSASLKDKDEQRAQWCMEGIRQRLEDYDTERLASLWPRVMDRLN